MKRKSGLATRLLNTFGRMIAQASPKDRKAFFRTVLEEVVVANREIVEICPRPNFYDLLLCVQSAPEWGPIHSRYSSADGKRAVRLTAPLYSRQHWSATLYQSGQDGLRLVWSKATDSLAALVH